MIKIAVFDLDGTLVNSLEDLANSVNKGLVKAGLPEQPVENFNMYVGNGRDAMIRCAMGDFADDRALFDVVKNTFDTEYAVHCSDNTKPYDGCESLLKRLAAANIKTAVLSNKPDKFVSKILERAYPEHKFDEAWGQKPQYKRKPDGEALLAMLKKYGFKANECVYIGDSDVDVYTAKNAGTAMAGVDWGFRGRDELISAGAPFVASSVDELFDYIIGEL